MFVELFGSQMPESGAIIVRPLSGEISVAAWLGRTATGGEPTVTTLPVLPVTGALGLEAMTVFHGVRDASRASIVAITPADASTPALGLIETTGASAKVKVAITHESKDPSRVQPLKSKFYDLAPGQALLVDDIVRQVVGETRETEGSLFKVSVTVSVESGPGRVVPYLVNRVVGSGDRTVRVR